MMRSMFGNRYKPDTMTLHPFRAWVSWLCHFIGLHPMLRYTALSGLHLYSPERAKCTSEAATPLAINISGAVLPLSIKKEKL